MRDTPYYILYREKTIQLTSIGVCRQHGGLLVALLALLLLLEHFGLLLLQGLEARGQSAGLFVGVVLVGFVVGFKFGQEFGVVGSATQPPHGQGAEEERDEVVVVEAGRVLVEHEEEEERHEHHHPLHHLHLLRLLARHRFALLAHGHVTVKQVGAAEEQAEEAEVVADAPDVEVPGKETVVGGEVVGPEEALLAKLDGVRHKVKHGNPDGHLDEHGQAAAHGAHAILRVERHGFLLALQGILLLGIFGRNEVDFGLEYTHFGTAHVTLAGGHIDNDAEQDGDEQKHDAHGQTHAGEEVEDVEREITVYPAHNGPAQVNEFLKVVLGFAQAVVVHALQQAVVVGAEEELELRGCGTCGVEGGLHLSVVVLQIAAVLFFLLAFEVNLVERLLGHEHGTEVLVFESNPVHLARDALLLGSVFREFLGIVAVHFVSECGVHVFKIEPFFVLCHAVVPGHGQVLGARGQHSLHALGLHAEVHQIVVG